MKKSLILSAALFAAFGANAEVFTYDFNTSPAFFKTLQAPEEEDGLAWKSNYDFIDKNGATKNTDNEPMIYTPEGATKGIARANRIISLLDGLTYLLTPEENSYGYEVATEEILSQPFISWGEKGITRTLWMQGWASTDAWPGPDANYDAATAEDWVSTKHGLQFGRIGTQGMVSRGDTWVQFPAVEAPAKLTVYVGSFSDKSSKDQILKTRVTPVVDGVAQEPVLICNVPAGEYVEKRYYKKEYTYNGTGKVAFRVGPEDQQMYLFHVVIESNSQSGIENIIANDADENAPVYNVMGIQVDENYKGVVIKNGKKYIQR